MFRSNVSVSYSSEEQQKENLLEKWFPLWGERAHSLKLFCMYDKRFEISKTNRMEEETEPQT